MAISGPIALYSNPPIQPEFYQPWRFKISNVSIGTTTTVTMIIPSITHLGYVIAQQVRLLIPSQFGCRQLNGQTGYVLSVILPNQVIVNIDSRGSDPFTPSSVRNQPQIVAIGDGNSGQISSTGRLIPLVTIPGSFINISPN